MSEKTSLSGKSAQPYWQQAPPKYNFESEPGSFRRLGEVMSRRNPGLGSVMLDASDQGRKDVKQPPAQRPEPIGDPSHYYSPTFCALGLRDAVVWAMWEAMKQMELVPGGAYRERLNTSMKAGACCLFVELFFAIQRIVVAVITLLLCTVGFLFLGIGVLPKTAIAFYSSIIYKSPRFGPFLKTLMAILFIIPLILSIATIPLIGLFAGLSMPFWVDPAKAIPLACRSMTVFWDDAQKYKSKVVFGSYEQQTDPPTYYEFNICYGLVAIIFALIGGVVGCVAFLLLALLQWPRVLCIVLVWIWKGSKSECFCCTCPFQFFASLMLIIFSVVIVAFTPIWGLFDGLITCFQVTWMVGLKEGFLAIYYVPRNWNRAIDEWVMAKYDPAGAAAGNV